MTLHASCHMLVVYKTWSCWAWPQLLLVTQLMKIYVHPWVQENYQCKVHRQAAIYSCTQCVTCFASCCSIDLSQPSRTKYHTGQAQTRLVVQRRVCMQALQSTFPGLGLPPNQQPRHALAVPPQQMPQHVQPPVQPPHPAPAPPQPTLSPWVTRAVVACIAMVLTINQSTDFGTPEAVTVR